MWVAKFPWVEIVIRKLNMVRCKIYNEIDGREKLLVPKFDNLQKHGGRWKCKVAQPRCTMGQYFMYVDSQHVKNKHL